jgi:hypothetical protein
MSKPKISKAFTEARKIKTMNEFDEQFEILGRIAATQPGVLTPSQKMQLGLWRSSQKLATANGLTTDDRLRLAGFKQRISQDVLSPNERTVIALEITNLEKKTQEIKKNDTN